jgi:hypothetical protein
MAQSVADCLLLLTLIFCKLFQAIDLLLALVEAAKVMHVSEKWKVRLTYNVFYAIIKL